MKKRPRAFHILANMALLLMALFAVAVGVAFLSQSDREYRQILIDAGRFSISGKLSRGSKPDGVWVILVHGNRAAGIAHPLYQAILRNIDKSASVVGIDMRGFGASGNVGMATAQRILDREDDIVATASWIKRESGASDRQIVLVGHSLGALQVLHAAGNADYGGVVSIGPGAFERYVESAQARRSYIEKIERNTGIRMSEEILIQDASRLMLPDILTPCPAGDITVIHGAREENMLNSRRSEVPAICEAKIDWQSIPFSDHMYGTESRMLQPVANIYSLLTTYLLMRQINRSIERAAAAGAAAI